ncbi:unnamed protein product [Cuscuta epithymum]|uniref:Uncharacterized protein n=1 Tax=Cuscuta epithymum TaxID=186058 RepID=A0AAV0EMC7_9ASTE|nr:unnamed protein product [Cuscuta epithymum]
MRAFTSKRALCGEILHRECHHPILPFFPPSPAAVTPPPQSAKSLNQNMKLHDGGPYSPVGNKPKSKRPVLIIGLSLGFFILICSVICFAMATRKSSKPIESAPILALDPEAVTRMGEESSELEDKVRRVQEGMQVMGKSGNLVFSVGESQMYTLEQLLRLGARQPFDCLCEETGFREDVRDV